MRRPAGPLQRGGLAVREAWVEVSAPAPGVGVRDDAIPRSPLQGVRMGLCLGGFLLYLLVITSYRLPVGDIAMAMALAGCFLDAGRRRTPLYLACFALFTVWAIFASSHSPFPDLVAEQTMVLVKLVLIMFVAANAMRTKAQVRLFMVFFLACFALFPMRGAMFNYFFYGNTMQGRAIWNLLYGNPNDLGSMALLQLSMAVALVGTEPRGWIRRAALLGIFMLPMLILMTQSRGVFLGLMIFAAIVITGQRHRVKLLFRLAVLALALALVAPASVWGRLGTLKNATSTTTLDQVDGAEGSARQRHEIWRVAFRMIEENPVTGVGLGAYEAMHEVMAVRAEFNPTARGARDTHSLYFNVLAETGYPGLALYLSMFVVILVPTERVRRKIRASMPARARQLLVLEAGLAGFMVSSVFGSLPYLPHMLLHLVLLHSLAGLYVKDLAGAAAGTRSVVRPSARAGAGSLLPAH